MRTPGGCGLRRSGRCHPRFAAFLAKKLDYDPAEVFRSDWYLHHRRLFGG